MGTATAVTRVGASGALFGTILLSGACGVLPAGQPSTARPATPSPPAETQSPEPAGPSAAVTGCSVAIENDEIGPGSFFRGTGFPPDVPLEMTFTDNAGTSPTFTEADFASLRSDVRGAFEIHMFANRENIGPSEVEFAGGGCTATLEFVVREEAFPVAACDKIDEPPVSGSEAADAYAAAVLDDDPLAYWRFEEEGGRSVADSAGGEDGELVVDATLGQPGFIDGSRAVLLFGGEDWVDVPDLQLSGDFTIEGWLRFCGENIGNADVFVGQAGLGADINFWLWRMRLWTGDVDAVEASRMVSRDGWMHIAATRMGDQVELFQDGDSVGTGESDSVFPIKAIGSGSLQELEGSLEGWLDEIAIYDHALSAERIAERAAFGK